MPADGVDVTELPDGFVIYDEARDIVHYLNPTAAVAFTACDGTGRAPGTARFTYERASNVIDRTFAAEARGAVTILAASMLVGDRRVLILSDHWLERSRFVLDCVGEGYPVETDRLVLLRGTDIFPMPVRMRIHVRTAQGNPTFAGAIRHAPSIDDWDGNVVHAV